MKLPVNEKIKESLFKVERKWEELFDENSLYKSLYCLQIIEEFMLSSSSGYFSLKFNQFIYLYDDVNYDK